MKADLAQVRFTEMLHLARSRNASDVHMRAGMPPVMRIDGTLQPQQSPALDADDLEAAAEVMLCERSRIALQRTGDASSAYRASDAGNVRVHAYRSSGALALALRLLAANVPALESLRLPAVLASLADRPAGLLLFTGPTGSGKSTAMAAIVDRINRTHAKHILTLEDPIEYVHRSEISVISQREVGGNVGSFAVGVEAALRCDPNVVLIGEMRDADTMQAAITAAETGHLVLATLHTGDAAQTIDRITGAFSGTLQDEIRMRLAQTLLGVVCMRLVPLARSAGRRGASEILIATDAVRNVVRDGKTHQLRNIIATSRSVGMQTLESHLCDLIDRGEITLDAAMPLTARADELLARAQAL